MKEMHGSCEEDLDYDIADAWRDWYYEKTGYYPPHCYGGWYGSGEFIHNKVFFPRGIYKWRIKKA